jgi:hypothetical protein
MPTLDKKPGSTPNWIITEGGDMALEECAEPGCTQLARHLWHCAEHYLEHQGSEGVVVGYEPYNPHDPVYVTLREWIDQRVAGVPLKKWMRERGLD